MVSLGGEGAFPPGSTVKFVTALNDTVSGEVVCFDPAVKALVIKDAAPGAKPILRMFNMAMIKDVQELPGRKDKESIESLLHNCQPAPEKTTADAERRLREELMEENVSLEGQHAFIQLRRTLNDVQWKGADIRVLDRVLVKSPYTKDSVEAIKDDDQCHSAVSHVKKILSKPFVPDRRLTACNESP